MTDPVLTLKQLRYLVAIAETGHFRHAAERCGITQPSLSIQIQNLEGALGVRLVERGRSQVILTPIGRDVVERGRGILLNVQAIVDAASASNRGLAGMIRLGVKPTLGPYLLPSVVHALHGKHPELKLYIREGAPHELEDELKRGVHDLALLQLPGASTDILTERLFREPIYLAIAAEHPLARHDEVSIGDLAGLPVLTLTPGYLLHDQVHDLCKEFGAALMSGYEGTSLDALRQMVAMNMGATFLPALYARSEIHGDADVVLKTLREREISRSIGLAWRRSSGRSTAYSEVAEVIRSIAREQFDELFIET